MREAGTVLGIIRKRGCQRLPLEKVYRQLYNPNLYLRAYGRLYGNKGAMTQSTTEETVDGMSQRKIHRIIEALRDERYRWTPAKRVHIPKQDGRSRALGIPSWPDKLLQEVIRSLLEAYYEPQFSDKSHGFRPQRGCHTALRHIKKAWSGTKWFIEGDIRACFDSLDHSILVSILQRDIYDNRFIHLIQNLLQVGYLEQWRYTPTLSGSPQGAVVSPILSNIYLNQLDRFVEQTLRAKYTQGKRRAHNPEYDRLSNQAYHYRRKGRVDEAKQLEQQRRSVPANNPYDPNYRRLHYCRYADDFLLGFMGPRQEAERIKEAIRVFLWDQLKLELSEAKTLITHASTEPARFLGYEITVNRCDSKITTGRRSINGGIALRIPVEVVNKRCQFYMRKGKPIHRKERTHETDYSIICRYQAEYRGHVQYYRLAENVAWLNKLYWVTQTSLLKTLAHKHKSSVAKMARKYATTVMTPVGPRRCFEVQVLREGKSPLTARFGGIPLRTDLEAVLEDQPLNRHASLKRTELLQRLLADTCEVCGATENIEVHHVRKLADLNPKGRKAKPDWMHLMASRRRKTLVLCRQCHDDVHAGRPLRPMRNELLESRMP